MFVHPDVSGRNNFSAIVSPVLFEKFLGHSGSVRPMGVKDLS